MPTGNPGRRERRPNKTRMRKSGEKFYREDDWNIGERQAEDLRRAQDVAKYRKAKEAVDEAAKATTNYPQAAIVRGDFLTNWTGAYDNIWTEAQAEQWKRDKLGSDEAWRQQQQEEWEKFTEMQRNKNEQNREEGEADRSERRSRDRRDRDREDIRKENLISQERIRIASSQIRRKPKTRRKGPKGQKMN